MSSVSGIRVDDECVTKFNELKLGKGSLKWIIFMISDDYKSIVVEDDSKMAAERIDDAEKAASYDFYRETLIASKSKNKAGQEGPGARYGVFDVEYTLGNEGKRSKITFFSWCPDNASPNVRMVLSSSRESLRSALNGLAADIQANDTDDLEEAEVMSRVAKGGR